MLFLQVVSGWGNCLYRHAQHMACTLFKIGHCWGCLNLNMPHTCRAMDAFCLPPQDDFLSCLCGRTADCFLLPGCCGLAFSTLIAEYGRLPIFAFSLSSDLPTTSGAAARSTTTVLCPPPQSSSPFTTRPGPPCWGPSTACWRPRLPCCWRRSSWLTTTATEVRLPRIGVVGITL